MSQGKVTAMSFKPNGRLRYFCFASVEYSYKSLQ